jgi:hypothetical protein
MVDLKEHSTIADNVIVLFTGSGYYSGKVISDLSQDIVLEKVCDLNVTKSDVKYHVKSIGYNVIPYKIKNVNKIPLHWTVETHELI